MTVKFTNNASTTVATGINTTATSLVVASAAGFPALSGSGDYCYLTIQQAAGTNVEVVKATALSSNTFTIVRAQDGTSAGSWSVSDVVELRVTAALLTDIVDAATHDASVLSVDSTNNRVGVNDTTPSVTLDISGTDAIALPVGTTAERPTGAAGRFRYNSSLSQFEGYTDAWGAIGGGGTNTFTTDTFTANGSLVAFNLSQTVSSENNLLVFIDGVFQTQDAYAIATTSGTTTLTFSAAPANGRKIVVYSVAAGISGANLNIDSMTGDGSDTTMTLTVAPVTEQNTQVFIDGVYQSKSNYSISGTTLTFSTAPPTGTAVEVMTFTQTDINVPVDGTITSAKLSGDLTLPGDLSFADNNKATFGASNDLQIYHDGSNSWIKDTGIGSLVVQAEDLYLQSPSGNNYIVADTSTGALKLYHASNAVKLATTATGIDVTGTVTADGVVTQATANTYPGGAAIIKSLAGDASYITNVGGSFLISNNSSSDQFALTSAGNMGVGTSIPYNNSKLDVLGSIISTSQTIGTFAADNAGFDFAAATKVGRFFSTSSDATGGHMTFITGASGGLERMRIDSAGTTILSHADGAANLGRIQFSTQATTYQILGGNNIGYMGYKTGGYHRWFGPDTAEDMRLDSSGRLLVNTASPLIGSAAKLQVLQNITDEWSARVNNNSASPYGFIVEYSSATPNNGINYFFYANDSSALRFAVNSNGGIRNFSANNVNLSDRNAKKDITLHTDSEWNCVKAWEIVDYRYKDEADDSPAKIGVTAQQIQEHCPDLVTVFQEQADAVEEVIGEDGEVVTEAKAAVEERIGVNESQMMWKVTKALQEAMERIETLEAKVQTLENN